MDGVSNTVHPLSPWSPLDRARMVQINQSLHRQRTQSSSPLACQRAGAAVALHRRPDGTAAVLSRGLGGECPPTERRRRPRHFIEKRVPLALGKASVALGSGEGHGPPVAGLGGPEMRAVAGEPHRRLRLRRHLAASCSKPPATQGHGGRWIESVIG